MTKTGFAEHVRSGSLLIGTRAPVDTDVGGCFWNVRDTRTCRARERPERCCQEGIRAVTGTERHLTKQRGKRR